MNFSELFIRRPIATSLLMAAIALFGVVSYRALPPSKPDLGLGEPAVAVIAARTMGGRDFAAGWVTRPGRSRWQAGGRGRYHPLPVGEKDPAGEGCSNLGGG